MRFPSLKIRSRFLLLFVAIGSGCLADFTVAEEPENWLRENIKPLARLYLKLHKNPELSFEEQETSALMAAELEKIGATVTPNVGGYGVVAILENGDGPTVMLRADMDGLPIVEQTNRPYASTKKVKDKSGNEVGVMHACGHDIHMTNLIGVAQYLSANQDRWSGRVMFICQPAEERGSGAAAMINDGLFEKFGKPDFAIAPALQFNVRQWQSHPPPRLRNGQRRQRRRDPVRPRWAWSLSPHHHQSDRAGRQVHRRRADDRFARG